MHSEFRIANFEFPQIRTSRSAFAIKSKWFANHGVRTDIFSSNSAWERSHGLLLATFSIAPAWLIARPFSAVHHFDPNWHRGFSDAGAGQPFAYKDPSSCFLNSNLPREILDFTVPMLICKVSAISS